MNKSESSAASFDAVASAYDSGFTKSETGKLQRNRVHYFMEKFLTGGPHAILEINCGTGEDALWMGRKGHKVTATDTSSMMIEMAKKKQASQAANLHIAFHQVAFQDLKNHFHSNTFDLIFSDFGGLNCVNSTTIAQLSLDISKMLKPGGFFIAVIMGRKCLWEQLYFLLKGKPKKAFRRFSHDAVNAEIGSSIQPTWYFSPGAFKRLFQKNLSFQGYKPVGFFIPPSYMEPFFRRKSKLLVLLDKAERVINYSFLADFADHYLIIFKKK